MRHLTRQVFEELINKPMRHLSDVEVAQLLRSNRSGSGLRSEARAELNRRGLLDASGKEIHKNLRDYSSHDPVQHNTELDDFNLPLEVFRDHINALIEEYGPRAQIYCDAGYNNVSVYVETSERPNDQAS